MYFERGQSLYGEIVTPGSFEKLGDGSRDQVATAPPIPSEVGGRGGLPRSVGVAMQTLGGASVGEAARGVTGEVREDVIGLANE